MLNVLGTSSVVNFQ